MARLLPSSTLSAGTVIPFHVAVNTNNLEIYVGQIDLTVTDTPTITTVVRTNHRDGYYRGDCHFFFILFFSSLKIISITLQTLIIFLTDDKHCEYILIVHQLQQ